MKLEFAQQLFEGKRMDEVLHDVQFMNEKQVSDLSNRLFALTYDVLVDEEEYRDVWDEIFKRHDYHLALRKAKIDARIAELGGFRHGEQDQAYVKRDDSLPAVKQVFGDIAVAVYQQEYDHGESINDTLTVIDTDHDVQISCDAENIVIEFVNGNRVEFSNSEWAAISRLK